MRKLLAFAVIIFAVLVVPLKGQDSEWKYKHSKDAMTDKESDMLAIQGHYLNGITSQDEGTPAIVLSCSNGKMNDIGILTGVVLDSRPNLIFGVKHGDITTTKTRVDEGKPKTDHVADVAEDFKSIKSKNFYAFGGSEFFFAKKLIVEVYSHGSVEMEFDIPADSSPVEKYCGIKRR
jgi:hypothetical protein